MWCPVVVAGRRGSGPGSARLVPSGSGPLECHTRGQLTCLRAHCPVVARALSQGQDVVMRVGHSS